MPESPICLLIAAARVGQGGMSTPTLAGGRGPIDDGAHERVAKTDSSLLSLYQPGPLSRVKGIQRKLEIR